MDEKNKSVNATNAVPIPPVSGASQSASKTINPPPSPSEFPPIRVIKLPLPATASIIPTSPAERKNFVVAAKSFEAVISSLVELLDSTSCKFVRNRASKVTSREQAEQFADLVRLEAKSKQAATEAGARIAARHCTNEEWLDFAILGGVAIEVASGYAEVCKQIKILQDLQNANKKSKAT
jgi:hypothetical protein